MFEKTKEFLKGETKTTIWSAGVPLVAAMLMALGLSVWAFVRDLPPVVIALIALAAFAVVLVIAAEFRKLWENRFFKGSLGVMAVAFVYFSIVWSAAIYRDAQAFRDLKGKPVQPPININVPPAQVTLIPDSQVAGEHLKRLHAALQADSYQFDSISGGLRNSGISLGIQEDTPEAQARLVDSLWRPDRLMSPDFKNHYPQYFEKKVAIEREIAQHDTESYSVLREIIAAVPGTNADVRQSVGRSAFDQCQGRMGMELVNEPNGNVRVFDHDYYRTAGASASEPLRALYQASLAFKPSSGLTMRCAGLAEKADRLSGKVEALKLEAGRLSEVQSLAGTCDFIK